MLELFTYIETKSFQSAWFWIMLAVHWSAVSNRTLNVPYDMIARGMRGESQAITECELLAGIAARRNRNFYRNGSGGTWTGILFFLLAATATFGFIYGYEFSQALFMMLAPMTLVWVFAFRLSFRMETQELGGQALCKALLVRRFWNQVLGICVMSICLVLMIIKVATQTVFWL